MEIKIRAADNKFFSNYWKSNLFIGSFNQRNFVDQYKSLMLVTFFCLLCTAGFSQIKEPYRPLEGGAFKGKSTSFSPDPIIGYQWKKPVADDSLQIYRLFPKSHAAYPYKAFSVHGSDITINGTGDIRFDFGQVNAGWVEFESDSVLGEILVSISEYTEPAILNSGAQNPVKTLKPTRHGNTYRLELNSQLYEGVRFAWLHVKTFTKPWKLTNFRLVCQIKPVNYAGSFSSNDAMLNRIWYTGAYVVKLNILQDYLGAILMERSDRHSWTGDAYPSQAASLVSFGNFDFVRKNIVFTSTQYNGIEAYSMYWVLGLLDYYNYTGDAGFLKSLVGNASDRLEKSFQHFDSLPNLAFMGWDERLGAGFENPQIPENQHAYRWLCINAWLKFSMSMSMIGEIALAEKFKHYAEIKTAQLINDKKTLSDSGVHAVSEIFNSGITKSSFTDNLGKKWYENRNARLSYSPFNQYFILQGMARAGFYKEALTTLKDQWGGQINYGGTTFFEVFRPSWNDALAPNSAPINNQCGYTSLAHPWGAGVTRWLSEEILGVRTISPGFKTFSIIPWLGDSLTWVRGTVPTPLGKISASFNSVSGICEIGVPEGSIAAKVGIPKGGKNIKSITLNGRIVKFKDENPNHVFLENLSPGNYKINVSYGKPLVRAVVKTDLLTYDITNFEIDSTTGGNWKDRFGKDGYLIFGGKGLTNKLSQPQFIDSVKIQRAISHTWALKTTDARALQSVDNEDRTASAAITQDPIPTLQTFTVDLFKQNDKPYFLSLYFVDWDEKGRRSAFELFDASSLEIIAPVQVIDHYGKGKYVRFKVDRAIRIRINQVRGPNAALAGIFFN